MNFLKKLDRKYWFVLVLFAAVLLALIVYAPQVSGFFSWIWNAISALVIGACIAYVLNILMDFFSERVFGFLLNPKLRRILSLVCAILTLLIVFIALALIVIPQLVQALELLARKIPGALDALQNAVTTLTQRFPALSNSLNRTRASGGTLSRTVTNFLRNELPKTLSGTFSFVSQTFKSVMSFFIAVLFALYLLMAKKSLYRQVKKIVYGLLPEKYANETLYIFHLTNEDFRAFIYGRVFDAVLMAIAYGIIAFIFRLPYTLMIVSIIAVFSVIPLFGAIISWGIGFFLIVTVNFLQAVLFSVIILSILFITRNFIYPRLIGSSLGLPDIWVFAAVVVGGKLFGLPGMLTAVPIFSVLYRLASEFVNRRLSLDPKKERDVETPINWERYDPETEEFKDTTETKKE